MKQVQKFRRELHQIPELDRTLPKTIAYLKQQLQALSCSILEPAESALAAYFDFGKQSSLAFRADMDALAIEEKNTCDYRSCHPHQMHACGHDAHMAILLEFACRLHQFNTCDYNVLLLFQPAEETNGGAKSIIDSGILTKFHVKALFGFHVWPALKKGRVASKAGVMMAKSAEIDIVIKGKRAHIAQSDKGKDALKAAVAFLQEVQRVKATVTKQTFLLEFGYMQSGSARNVISDTSVLKGTLRTWDGPLFQQLFHQLKMIGERIETEYGCPCQVQRSVGYPALINDLPLYERAHRILGDLYELPDANLLSEDFAYYGSVVPSVFFYLGLGESAPLHSDHFDFDDAILSVGVETYLKLLHI